MITLYHGTSAANSGRITGSDGLRPSQSGMLGPGLYLAQYDKAKNFALDSARRGHVTPDVGGRRCTVAAVLTVQVDLGNCKQIHGDDPGGSWRSTHDSVHTTSTSASRREEWCIKDMSSVHVTGIEYIDTDDGTTDLCVNLTGGSGDTELSSAQAKQIMTNARDFHRRVGSVQIAAALDKKLAEFFVDGRWAQLTPAQRAIICQGVIQLSADAKAMMR